MEFYYNEITKVAMESTRHAALVSVVVNVVVPDHHRAAEGGGAKHNMCLRNCKIFLEQLSLIVPAS